MGLGVEREGEWQTWMKEKELETDTEQREEMGRKGQRQRREGRRAYV